MRLMVFDRADNYLFDIAAADIFELTKHDAINKEHSLTITTPTILTQGQRVLIQDDRGFWHEYVVVGVDTLHDSGERPFGTYYCVWSLQPDLMGTRVSKMPGVQNPVAASIALDDALSGTKRWVVGTVTNLNTGGASMYDTDGWTALSTLIETWGGELDVTIEVNPLTGVTARKVDYYAQQGEQEAKRRFDFAADVSSVRRVIADSPLYCRVTPRGRGEESDEGGYGRKITIEEVNDGKDYLENDSMVDLAKLPDGQGGWEYPTIEIENSDCETPADLKAWALEVIDDYTLPKVTYEVDALQLGREGVDLQGVSLGDAVHVVDKKFGEGLRLAGRVIEMYVDLMTGATSRMTIGSMQDDLSNVFSLIDSKLSRLSNTVEAMNGGTFTTADYLSRLLARLNGEINVNGGYTYITEGQGIRTYNTAVTDPLEGEEASSVVEIKGGSIRIANSKTAQGAWEWKTVFVSGHIAADMVTAASITAGYIGGASGNNFWNLDSGDFSLKDNSTGLGITKTSGTLNIDGSVINVDRLYPKEIIAPDKTYGLAFRSPSSYSQIGDSLLLLADPTGSSPRKLAQFEVLDDAAQNTYDAGIRFYDSQGSTAVIGSFNTNNGGIVTLEHNSGRYISIDSNSIHIYYPNDVSADITLTPTVGNLGGQLNITCYGANNTLSWIHLKPGQDPTFGH